jgi:hypothetical protein
VPAVVKKELSGASADWAGRPARHYRQNGAAYRKGLRRLD